LEEDKLMTTTTTDDSAIRTGSEQRADARQDARLDWFRDARFGMFIHWGLYALPAGEWRGKAIPGIGEWIMLRARIPVAEYERLAEQFNPAKFDADAWAALAAQAGAKYLVITAKHHDGFCMYRTRVGDYNIVDRTPFGRDPMQELAAACQRHGVRLCFYYSQTQDWHHPNGDGNDWDYDESKKDFDGYVENYVKPQVRELLTNYGPIGLIWFDTPKRMTPEQSRGLVDFVHQIQPDCLVNGRIGNGLGDYAETGDNRIPSAEVQADWETPATINDTWGFKRLDDNWKSPADLVHKLVDIASKGGNYLLNVGPTAEGVIPQPSVERMQAVGTWLKTNGEAVYGTRPGPLQGVDAYRTTRRGSTVFVHVFDWPADGVVRMPALPGRVSGARFQATGAPVQVQPDGQGWILHPEAASAPDPLDTVIVLELTP
jgi:alpha-L-fucosidase